MIIKLKTTRCKIQVQFSVNWLNKQVIIKLSPCLNLSVESDLLRSFLIRFSSGLVVQLQSDPIFGQLAINNKQVIIQLFPGLNLSVKPDTVDISHTIFCWSCDVSPMRSSNFYGFHVSEWIWPYRIMHGSPIWTGKWSASDHALPGN